MKLIIFPNAGTFASSFNKIKEAMPELDIDVYEYANHGSRYEETPYGTFEEMTDKIAEDLCRRYQNEAVGFFGHCMGAYVAYEVAIVMKRRYGVTAQFLIVSGSVPPDEFDKRDKIFDSDESFLEYMKSVDGVMGEVRKNERMLRAVLPILKRDAERLHCFLPTALSEEEKLSTPVGVIYGEHDKEIDPGSIGNWQRCTNEFLGVKKLRGDHFYLFADTDAAADAIRHMVRDALYAKVRDLRTLLEQNAMAFQNRSFIQYKENGRIAAKTFRGFRNDVNAVTHYLSSNHYEGKHIAIIGDTSYLFFVGFLAAALTPGVVIPVDAKFTPDEIRDVLERGDAELIMFQDEYAEQVEAAASGCSRSIKLLPMGELAEITETYPAGPLHTPIDPQNPVTMFFTSGTTGLSKGVLLSTQNILDNLSAVKAEVSWNGENLSWLSVLPNHHVFCITVDFLLSLIGGITVSISRMDQMYEDAKLFKASKMLAVPMMLKYFLYQARMLERKYPEYEKKKIKNLLLGEAFDGFCCSAAFLEEDVKKAVESYGITVIQGYGLTECTSHVSSDSLGGPRPGSVGKVLDALDIRLVENEIWLKGAGVMLGYYKDEQATREAIEDGWLKTGDLGYLDEDGWLYLTGRKKNLIILSNGENVSPEELEIALDRNDLVEEVMVSGRNDILTAEIYLNPAAAEGMGKEKAEDSVRKYVKKCNENMASHKQIHSILFRDAPFIKTNTGKIKRYMYSSKNKA